MKLRKKQQRKERAVRQSRRDLPSQKAISYSYYRSHNKSDQTEQSGNKKSRMAFGLLAKRGVVLILLLVGLFLTLYVSVLSNQAKVTVDNPATGIRETSVYEQLITEHINKSVLNRSKLTFDTQGLIDSMQRSFPEVAGVDVTLPIIARTPRVEVLVTEPKFLLISDSSSALVGENGITLAVMDAKKLTQNDDLTQIIDETGITPEPGKVALPSEQARFLNIVKEQFAAKDVQIESLAINSSPYDLRVRIVGEKYYVKFNVLEDPIEQAGSLLAFFGGEGQERRSLPREYIDVRVSERLFYR